MKYWYYAVNCLNHSFSGTETIYGVANAETREQVEELIAKQYKDIMSITVGKLVVPAGTIMQFVVKAD